MQVPPTYTEGFEQVTDQAEVNSNTLSEPTDQATDQAEMLLKYCSIARTSKEIMEYLHLTHDQHFRDAILHPLIALGKLKRTIPDKPSSPNQKYIATGN